MTYVGEECGLCTGRSDVEGWLRMKGVYIHLCRATASPLVIWAAMCIAVLASPLHTACILQYRLADVRPVQRRRETSWGRKCPSTQLVRGQQRIEPTRSQAVIDDRTCKPTLLLRSMSLVCAWIVTVPDHSARRLIVKPIATLATVWPPEHHGGPKKGGAESTRRVAS